MSSTNKVLGTIGALSTLVDNFPMSLLDFSKGKVYTSAFEFIMDVLYACGVNTNDIINYLLEELYSIIPDVESGLESYKEAIGRVDFTKIQQTAVLYEIELSLKYILNALMVNIFGCSALPIIPSKVMDAPSQTYFNGLIDLWGTPQNIPIYPVLFEIPTKLIDPMGLLEITPTTIEGRAYYDIAGRDIYYEKKEKEPTRSAFFNRSISYNNNPISIEIDGENNILIFKIKNNISEDINFNIEYVKYNNVLNFTTTIKAGDFDSEKVFFLDDVDEIRKIKLNNSYGGVIAGDNNWCYLIENNNPIFNKDLTWGDVKDNTILGNSEKNDSNEYEYIKLNETPKDTKKFRRLNNVPSEVSENDADFIVVYDGPNPNELYKSNDMNAFIWYCLYKGNVASQIDKNYMMWDSRLSAMKKGFQRGSQSMWNTWYNTKQHKNDEFKDEFKDEGQPIHNDSPLYPILQLEKSPFNSYALKITFPAQRYYKPKYRLKMIKEKPESTGNESLLYFNECIYKFNYDYLNNIQLLKPKILITGFINYLLGGTISVSSSVNFTKKLIESKLSTAITKIVEADDMEVEDCYTTFSNDEFDAMMEEMLLARYTATKYNGDVNKTKSHDIKSYLALIDSYNASATKEESITKLTRLVNEITVSPGLEGGIEYGVEMDSNATLLKKLLWATVMPIMESLFTPQIMLLLYINMCLTGAIKIDDLTDFKLMNLILNKILSLIKSIVKYIKDAIISLLLLLFQKKVMPLLIKYSGALLIEKLDYWLILLTSALQCLPRFDFNSNKNKGGIDNVDYADIISVQNIPEASSPC